MEHQLQDLRSSVIREACRTLLTMAHVSGALFHEHMAFYLPILFSRLYVTIKIISQSSHDCIRALLERSHTVKSLEPVKNLRCVVCRSTPLRSLPLSS